MTKLKNQSEFAHTAYLGGENEGGVTSEGGDGRDVLVSARS